MQVIEVKKNDGKLVTVNIDKIVTLDQNDEGKAVIGLDNFVSIVCDETYTEVQSKRVWTWTGN